MNRTKTLAVALLVALLPFAPAAFASDRGHNDRGRDDRGQGRPDHARGHDYGHDRHGYRGHHYGHHYRHYDTRYYYGGRPAQVVLPFPPLPPFPVIVLNKRHNGAHVELRRPY
jgi:hypothetical protein